MVTRTERGWPGHYILADRCQFRRNTLLECGEQRVVVSTVGKLHTTNDKKWDYIGGDYAIFETMSFPARDNDGYWDADVRGDIPGGTRRITSYEDRDGNDMHEAVVSELTARLENGETLYTIQTQEEDDL